MLSKQTKHTILKTNRKSIPNSNLSVIGIGNFGCQAVNNMASLIKGINCVCCINIDALKDTKKQIEAYYNRPCFIIAEMGEITERNLVLNFVKECKEPIIAIFTIPLKGKSNAFIQNSIREIYGEVEILTIISKDKVKEVYKLTTEEAITAQTINEFTRMVKGIAETITIPGIMHVDYEDLKNFIENGGGSIMGFGIAKGKDRIEKALTQVINYPFLKDKTIEGANKILINIHYGTKEVFVYEVEKIVDFLTKEVSCKPSIFLGVSPNEQLNEDISITVVATDFR